MTATQQFVPGPQQADALESITAWYRDDSPYAQQIYRLFGYAGTGKTTLARHVVNALGLSNVCYAAYTGKAAHVMRTRGGCDGAGTIHSLIYQPLGADDTELRRLVGELEELDRNPADYGPDEFAARRDDLVAAIAAEQRKPRSLQFTLRAESELADADLLILDEASMVNDEMAQDLLSFGVKILVLGDPAQLPPVSGEGFFTNAIPDSLLTQVHRVASENSPIIRIATSIRESQAGDLAVGLSGSDGNCGRFRGVRNMLAYHQVICGTNRTRWELINKIRALEGRYGPKPVPGDRIIILANSKDAGCFNGQQFTVLGCEVDPDSKGEKYMLRVHDDEGLERDLRVWAEGFINLKGEQSVKFSGRGLTAAATFAHAITTHKAQGSEWPNVLVVDESSVFRSMKAKSLSGKAPPQQVAELAHADARRWLYTAVTRASDRVSVVLPGAVR